MNRKVSSILLAAGLCTLPLAAGEAHLLTVANGGEIPAETTEFTAKPWFDGTLSIPLDRAMIYLAGKGKEQKKHFAVKVVNDGSLAGEYNAFVQKKLEKGETVDPVADRKKFLNDRCGTAAGGYIYEYLRIMERMVYTNFALSGFNGPLKPQIFNFYDAKVLDKLESLLKSAVRAAAESQYAAKVNAEYAYFRKCRTNIEKMLDASRPRFYVSGTAGVPAVMNGYLGDDVQVKSTVKFDVTPDKKSLIIKLFAEEPHMDKRRITGTGRDYPDAWKDDRFEIFIVPDPDKPQKCIQLIITSAGVFWDSKREDVGYDHNVSWNSRGQLEMKHSVKHWEAVLTVPFADFGWENGVPEKMFLANVYRYRTMRGVKGTFASWSPINFGVNFQPDRFGFIIWEDK